MVYLQLLMRCSGAKIYFKTPDLATLQLMSSRVFLLQAKTLSLHGIYNKRPDTICQYKKALGLNYL
jgi:hypothetical protein